MKARWFFLGVDPGTTAEPPLLRPGYLSRHVRRAVMASKGNGEVVAHPALLARLDAMGDLLGEPPIISGFRDPAHNRAVGGAPNSQHVLGTAVDLDVGYGLTVEMATELGFSGIGHIAGRPDQVAHVDVRAEGPNNTTGAAVGRPTLWVYPR